MNGVLNQNPKIQINNYFNTYGILVVKKYVLNIQKMENKWNTLLIMRELLTFIQSSK